MYELIRVIFEDEEMILCILFNQQVELRVTVAKEESLEIQDFYVTETRVSGIEESDIPKEELQEFIQDNFDLIKLIHKDYKSILFTTL